jgi:ATP-dependent 26S proteasome regulatory subunit
MYNLPIMYAVQEKFRVNQSWQSGPRGHRHSNALVDMLPPEADSSISLLRSMDMSNVTYNVSLFGDLGSG